MHQGRKPRRRCRYPFIPLVGKQFLNVIVYRNSSLCFFLARKQSAFGKSPRSIFPVFVALLLLLLLLPSSNSITLAGAASQAVRTKRRMGKVEKTRK